MILRSILAIASLVWAGSAVAEAWIEISFRDPSSAFPRVVTVAEQGVTVTVVPGPPFDDDADATIDVQFPGTVVYRVPADEHRASLYGISVGIGRMRPDDAMPTVLIGGYSGGAHCCATLQAISLVDGRPVAETLPLTDGDELDGFPRDLDGDGTADIRWSDDSLQYQFSGHAGSWNVPRI